MDELQQSLKKYNMSDEKSIKDILTEVDSDLVSFLLISSHLHNLHSKI